MSDSVRPHRRQPTRLPRPWESPGKNTGVGCHFLLQCMKVKSEREFARHVFMVGTPWWLRGILDSWHSCTSLATPTLNRAGHHKNVAEMMECHASSRHCNFHLTFPWTIQGDSVFLLGSQSWVSFLLVQLFNFAIYSVAYFQPTQ